MLTVPPLVLGADDDDDAAALDDAAGAAELLDDDEPLEPHAAMASAATAESRIPAHGRTYLFTDPPPEVVFPDQTM
ncbi:MAG: hypothetical protein ACRDL5_14375 [Solirubrobacteraceae bacterium]